MMFFEPFFAAAYIAVAVAGASAVPNTQGNLFGCGTPAMNESQKAVVQEMLMQETQTRAQNTASINVETYIHIVAVNKTRAGGYIDRPTVIQQVKVLNDNFAPSGISFTLRDIDWTIDSDWSENRDEATMKEKLRKGTYSTLNLYYVVNLGGSSLGVCYYPLDALPGSGAFQRDGCSILHTTVPGGSLTEYNEGKTTTHEVGHWFGLVHTFGEFGNGCYGNGDYVDDTPAQKARSKGCPTGIDTCPDLPGLDPIHNYMDYSYDSCYEEFTAGQITRMKNMWAKYRQGH